MNHVAYEMSTVDHFMRGIGRLRQHGVLPLWGPGGSERGDNTFSYFADPAGLVCEYTSGIAQVDEDRWLCKVWRRVPSCPTCGAPPVRRRRRFARHMAGVADPGAFERVAALSAEATR